MAEKTKPAEARVSSGFPRPEDVPGPTQRLRELHGDKDGQPLEPAYGRVSAAEAGSGDHVELDDMLDIRGSVTGAPSDALNALARRVGDEVAERVRAEIDRRDLGAKARIAGISAAELGAAGVLGICASGALVTAGIGLLSRRMPVWAAALTTAAACAGPAVALALVARRQLGGIAGQSG